MNDGGDAAGGKLKSIIDSAVNYMYNTALKMLTEWSIIGRAESDMKRAEKTELTRQKILQAAVCEFGRHGYAGGTVNRICESGISKGLVYHNFKDKDEIYLTCLQECCDSLAAYMKEQNCGTNVLRYMDVRWRWRKKNPDKAHILFEALLTPPQNLQDRIKDSMRGFEEMNLDIYKKFVRSLSLREGISEETALSYFCWMQEMFNAFFSNPEVGGLELDEKIAAHERYIQQFFNLMLYGIAQEKGGNE